MTILEMMARAIYEVINNHMHYEIEEHDLLLMLNGDDPICVQSARAARDALIDNLTDDLLRDIDRQVAPGSGPIGELYWHDFRAALKAATEASQ